MKVDWTGVFGDLRWGMERLTLRFIGGGRGNGNPGQVELVSSKEFSQHLLSDCLNLFHFWYVFVERGFVSLSRLWHFLEKMNNRLRDVSSHTGVWEKLPYDDVHFIIRIKSFIIGFGCIFSGECGEPFLWVDDELEWLKAWLTLLSKGVNNIPWEGIAEWGKGKFIGYSPNLLQWKITNSAQLSSFGGCCLKMFLLTDIPLDAYWKVCVSI